MNHLEEIIHRIIAKEGCISFARFMEMALYLPEHGYYERGIEQVGRKGDFYTSVSVGSLFGELLAFQFVEWLEDLALNRFQFVEAGAHDGRLALDILTSIGQQCPELFEQLDYWIIEPSTRRRRRQEKTLERFAGCVQWFPSWESLAPKVVRGIIFANELLDAFPVHRIGWDTKKRSWFEWGVDWNGSRFEWVRMAESRRDISGSSQQFNWPQLPSDLLALLPDGFTTEISPVAENWWQQAAASLSQGKLLTLDYGLTSDQFFSPERAGGTLRAYREHHVSSNVLEHVGEQDLTAQVNFTALQRVGERAGLRTERLNSQAEFLIRIAEKTWTPNSRFGDWSSKSKRQFQTLVHPEHLGRAFQVLVQFQRP